MKTSSLIVLASCLFTSTWAAATVPDCALDCMATIVPEVCGSLTNVTCICTSAILTAELTPCVGVACNVTSLFQLEAYEADLCGVPLDRTRVDQQRNTYFVMMPTAILFVALRLISRHLLDLGIQADDWMMLGALFWYLADVAAALMIASFHFGEHTYSLTTHQIQESLKWFYIAELFYIMAITFTKLSLLLFFRRIFPDKKFRFCVAIMFCFVMVSNFSLLMSLTFQCVPFHGNWTNWMYTSKMDPGYVQCINSYAVVFLAAGMSIFHDLVILLMPLPLLWKLHLPWQKKLNLLAMFSIGSFVVICSLIRLPSLLKLQSSSDPSYDQAPIAVWTDLETSVGIICGCLPACRSLIGWAIPALKMSLQGTSAKESAQYGLGYTNKSKQNSRKDNLDRDFIELNSQHDQEGERGRSDSIKSKESQIQFGQGTKNWGGFAEEGNDEKDNGIRTIVTRGSFRDGQNRIGEGNGVLEKGDRSRGAITRHKALASLGMEAGIVLTKSVQVTVQDSK